MITWRPVAASLLSAFVLATGCGGGSGGSSDGGVVLPSSRIGWDQQAASTSDLAALKFVIYVDDARIELPGATCTQTAGPNGYPCASPLPSMAPGQHTVQIASYIQADTVVESPRSAPLIITVSSSGGVVNVMPSSTAPAGSSAVVASPSLPRELVTSDGTRLRVDTIAAVQEPTALAVAEDGAVFVGDASGRIRVARNGVVGDDVLPVGATSGAILDLVLDSPDGRTLLVYAVDVSGGDVPVFRVVRYRAVDGQLGEQSVILGGVPASASGPSAALALAGDGRLFVALDDGGDADDAKRAGSYNGKVLRLNPDGTTPADQPGATPIYAANLRSPRSASWDQPSGSLWIADAGTQRTERLRRAARREAVATVYPLPLPGGPASVAVYRSSRIPSWQGSVLAAPAGDEGILVRARFGDASGATIASTERLAIPGATYVRLVKVGADGAVYLGTDREILKIGPQ